MQAISGRQIVAGAALALSFSTGLVAQQVQDTTRLEDTTRLKELVVTATRIPTSPDAIVSSATIIRGEDLRAQGIHFVHDALREVPGATVVQTGSFGGSTSLFLRGGESDYVKVLVDGVPVNQSGGAYNFANLTTDNIDRIEVVRGPASVLYGSDAVSGVVQVFTRRGQGPLTVAGGAEAGTFGSVSGHAGVAGGSRMFGYSADASRLSTDGTYAFNSGYHNTVLSGSLHGQPDPRSDAAVSVRYSDNRFHFPTDFSGMLADSNQFNTENAVSLGADLGRRLTDRLELRVSAGGSRTDGEFDDRPDGAADTVGFGFASHRNSRAQRGNIDTRLNGFVNSVLTLTTGAQVEQENERESGETTSNFGGIATTPDTPFDRGRTTVGYYAQAVLDLPAGLAVNVNGRLDHNSGFGTFFTYRAGAAYLFSEGTRIRASVGRAFKAPTFCEQFCDAAFVVGDSTLRPERSNSWEVGLEQRLLNQVSLWATYFSQRFRDMVVYDGSVPPGAPTYRNGAAARSRGIEAGVAAAFGTSMTATASYTYLDTKATDDAGMPSPSFANGQSLIRRPGHSAELALRSRVLSRATLGGSITYVGRRDDVDFSQFPSQRVELPGHAIVDLAGEVEILQPGAGRPGLSGVVRVENLFDKRYDQVVGFPGRTRGVYGGAKFSF